MSERVAETESVSFIRGPEGTRVRVGVAGDTSEKEQQAALYTSKSSGHR